MEIDKSYMSFSEETRNNGFFSQITSFIVSLEVRRLDKDRCDDLSISFLMNQAGANRTTNPRHYYDEV